MPDSQDKLRYAADKDLYLASIAFSAKRIADALESSTIPAGPIYWSEEEVIRLSRAMEQPHNKGSDMLRVIANEAVAILRDRTKG